MKPFAPEIKNPGATYLHEQYGISEARRVFLSNKMTEMTKVTSTRLTPVANHISQIAEHCDTANEFAFCVFIHGCYLTQSNKLLT